ncbi:MAG: hypothetical protein JWM98_1571, partial [Thermoleophilia bacterium]|nr:hypothetical protein [Thermoleophilia bacterium]
MLTTARRSVTLLILSALASAVVGVAHPGSAAAEPAVGVTGGTGVYYLVSFDTAGGPLTSQRRITGLTQTDFVGMTLRPSTGGLVFSTSSNPGGVNDTTGRAYSLDYATAVATPMSTPTFSSTLIDSTGLGLAISPVTDQLRVTSTSSENLRVNASSGAFIATDTPLSGAARGPAIAYDRSVVGATATTLYGIDTNSANLIRIG